MKKILETLAVIVTIIVVLLWLGISVKLVWSQIFSGNSSSIIEYHDTMDED